ncbi:MAG: transposase [Hyphomicrobiaceae bacterium]
MPELGEISREEAAALAGLAPFDDDSGKHNGHRHIAGGRARLRRSLYAAAFPPHSTGTRPSSTSTPASPPAAEPTNPPSSPAPESSSSTQTQSSSAAHPGRQKQHQHNGCYTLELSAPVFSSRARVRASGRG